jgi:hypothetical protein
MPKFPLMKKALLKITVAAAFLLSVPCFGLAGLMAQTTENCNTSGESLSTGIVLQVNISAEVSTCLVQDQETGAVYIAECAGLDIYMDDKVVYVKPKSTTKIIIRDIVRK